jgi:MFS family permease
VVKESSDAKVDLLVSFAYFCTAFAITLPIILVPAIAYQEYQLSARALTTFCSTVASVAMIGAGSGKIINGIVCQKIGGVATASIYAAGMSICSLALSFSRSLDSVRWIVAGMEFFSSAMWVAFSVIFSNHYKKEPMKIARGVSYLSLASASGQLIAKIFGSALLQFTGWRNIAKLGALVSFLGSMIVRFGLAETDKLAEANNLAETNDLAETNNLAETNDLSLDTEKKDEGMVSKIRSVLSSKVFWMVGFAHLAGHIAKSSDRILGAFLIEITALPFQVCGALTTCVTLGFVHGVMKSQSFFKLPSALEKERMLKRSYSSAALSLLGLALCGSRAVSSFPPSLLATVAVLCAGICSSSLAFPFYQIPNMVSSHFFAGNQALCLSYLDGFAFFLAAPIWALSNRITNSMGWSASWGFLFLLFGVCGKVMMKAIQPILVKKPLEEA